MKVLFQHSRSLLYKCIEAKQSRTLEYILRELKSAASLRHSKPETFNLLHIACKNRGSHEDDIECIKVILSYEPEVNGQDTYGNTPLHLASVNGKT